MQGRPNRRDRAKIILIALISVFLAVLAGGGVFLKIMHDKDTFFAETTINGYMVDGMMPDEVYGMLLDKYQSAAVEIDEDGRIEAQGSLADFGYSIDEEALKRLLQKAKA